jgi:hypothetical protein
VPDVLNQERHFSRTLLLFSALRSLVAGGFDCRWPSSGSGGHRCHSLRASAPADFPRL